MSEEPTPFGQSSVVLTLPEDDVPTKREGACIYALGQLSGLVALMNAHRAEIKAKTGLKKNALRSRQRFAIA